MKTITTLLGALLLAAMHQAHSQESLQVLHGQVPAPPMSAAAAKTWLESPALKRLRVQINDQHVFIEKLLASASASHLPTDMPEDFARAARDPKYAAELQERLAAMTPAQQMEFAQRYTAANNAMALRQVKAMGNEPPAVDAAVASYLDYQQRQMSGGPMSAISTRIEAIRDQTNQREMKISETAMKHLQCSDGEGGCPSKEAELADARVLQSAWIEIIAAYDGALTEIERLLATARKARAADIATGQRHMAATGYGSAAQSGPNRQQLATYHNAMLLEIEELLKLATESAQWASVRHGVRAVNHRPF